jgi:hypothetical protein
MRLLIGMFVGLLSMGCMAAPHVRAGDLQIVQATEKGAWVARRADVIMSEATKGFEVRIYRILYFCRAKEPGQFPECRAVKYFHPSPRHVHWPKNIPCPPPRSSCKK